jgi:hypothetical protein
MLGRQRDPGLDAMQAIALNPGALEPLATGDAAPGRHPVDFLRPDRPFVAEAVAMHDLAVEQVGHGRQTDMRMRANVDARPQINWPHMIEEDEGPDHLPLGEWQHATDLKAAAEAAAALLDDQFNHNDSPSGSGATRGRGDDEAASALSIRGHGAGVPSPRFNQLVVRGAGVLSSCCSQR